MYAVNRVLAGQVAEKVTTLMAGVLVSAVKGTTAGSGMALALAAAAAARVPLASMRLVQLAALVGPVLLHLLRVHP